MDHLLFIDVLNKNKRQLNGVLNKMYTQGADMYAEKFRNDKKFLSGRILLAFAFWLATLAI